MKNILRTIFIFVVGAVFLVSCEKKETNFDAMFNDWDPSNTTYYLQFVDNIQSLQTGVSLAGGFVEINTNISVVLIGNPLSSDLVVPITIDASSTLSPDMYTIAGGLNLTIQAGKTSASTTITSRAENMPVNVPLTLNLTINDANAAPTGSTAAYTFKRAPFCPWTTAEMAGVYTGSELNTYGINVASGASFEVFYIDATHVAVSGLAQSLWGPTYWGETPTAGNRVVLTWVANGFFDLQNQWILQTDGVWDYYCGPRSDVRPSWDGCTETIIIPFYFHWDDGYGDNLWFTATLVRPGNELKGIDIPVGLTKLDPPTK